MLSLISPAKKLDAEQSASPVAHTQPVFQSEIKDLTSHARKLNASQLKSLMGISDQLAELNVDRFKALSLPFTPANAKQAIFTFRGDVYQGLDADTLDDEGLTFAQDHVRILSGLYGVLRPLDLMQPYRLEMGIRLKTNNANTLYDYWGSRIAERLDTENPDGVLINLASHEYWRAVDQKVLKAKVVTPVFKEDRDGVLKIISFNAKRARGLMVRYIIDSRLDQPEGLKDFAVDGYRFEPKGSTNQEWLFTRRGA